MPLTSCVEFKTERGGSEIRSLGEGEVLRLFARLEQTENRELKDIAVDLGEVFGSSEMDHMIGGTHQRARRNGAVHSEDFWCLRARFYVEPRVDRRHLSKQIDIGQVRFIIARHG